MSRLEDEQALAWLASFSDSERTLPRTPAEFNLPRSRALLALLDNPQTNYPAVVIAGTKGKGSTAAMVEAILRAGGRHVGLYSSPHLHRFHERIQVQRQLISPAAVTALVEQMRPLIERLDPALGELSIYEVQTAMALAHFAAERVELAVLEIGLGGRHDAVNAVEPTVAAISSLSLDHTQILGSSLASIASHKAGIMRPGVPVVTVPQPAEAAAVLRQIASDIKAPLFSAETTALRADADGSTRPYPVPIYPETLGLKGLFQLENARLASGIAMLLRDAGFSLDDEAFATGLANVRWPGRFELLRPRLLVDGAHNGASAQQLMQSLRALPPYRRLILILGSSADKDLSAIAAALVPQAQVVILTHSTHPRAATVAALHSAVQPFLSGELLCADTVADALTAANERASPDDLICATGSLFIVAAVRELCGCGG